MILLLLLLSYILHISRIYNYQLSKIFNISICLLLLLLLLIPKISNIELIFFQSSQSIHSSLIYAYN